MVELVTKTGPVTCARAPLAFLATNAKPPLVQLNRVSMAEAALSTEQVIIAIVQKVTRAQTAR